ISTFIPGVGADGVPAPAAKPVKANYELAARWTTAKVNKLVFDIAVTPHWMDAGDRFWYSFETSAGRKFYIVDPAKKTKSMAFEYELAANKLALLDEGPKRKPAWASISPDDKTVVFARNHNLYLMDAENYAKAVKNANDTDIKETQLSTDGVEDFGYGGRGMGGGDQQQ